MNADCGAHALSAAMLARKASRSTTASAWGSVMPGSPHERRHRRRQLVRHVGGRDRPAGLARTEATPWRKAAIEPASCGSRPAASSDPAKPARTSPAPAVPSHGDPLRLTRVGRPACATRVRRPLSSTVAFQRSAAAVAWPSGSASTASRVVSSMLASSPAWGVSSAGTSNVAGRCCSALASTTTGTPSSRAIASWTRRRHRCPGRRPRPARARDPRRPPGRGRRPAG